MFTESASTPSTEDGTTMPTASPVPATLCEWWIAASRRVAAPIAAGFHHTASLPPRSATTAWPKPTDRAPTGRRRKSAPSSARPVCARTSRGSGIATAMAPAIAIIRLDRRCLIHEHDRNVIAHRVLKAARVAHEARLILPILELALTLGTNEDRKQLWR